MKNFMKRLFGGNQKEETDKTPEIEWEIFEDNDKWGYKLL
jgi:hypothetical protein